MKCNSVDNIVIGALVLTIVADCCALFAELVNQRCEKKEKQEQQKKEKNVNWEMNDLRKRITLLEKRIGGG